MIKSENIELNGSTFKRTYSDSNKMIHKVGTDEVYTEAVDLLTSTSTYVETSDLIEVLPEPERV